ncbi:hypothetical protein [Propioniciclava flava]|uniref:hypothetical protein n=1 Tax=Propioniciclava flava TaxID=2072026 RepID=UPI001F501D72|nr:hypothetical protein [Propioniciclava flava]
MNTATLPASTHMGSVVLDVADLDALTAFYRDVLLLDQISAHGDTVDLGRGTDVLVRLRHRPGLPRGERRTAGLFHTAILHDGPTALATTLASFAQARPGLYTGSGDHLVSQAFYLDDPEGNGVELYYDRPRRRRHHPGTPWIAARSDHPRPRPPQSRRHRPREGLLRRHPRVRRHR